jgi:uncharacterized protein YcfJ
MNKSLLIGTMLGVAMATAGGVFAGYKLLRADEAPPAPAVHVAAAGPAQPECVPNEPRDKKRIAGTVVGALVGGAVGKDVGQRKITTAAGAAAGAYVGNQVEKKVQENRDGCEP